MRNLCCLQAGGDPRSPVRPSAIGWCGRQTSTPGMVRNAA